MTAGELKAIGHLKALLQAAESEGYPISRMHVCDGYLAALCTMTDKEYGFSGTDVFIRNGKEIEYV